MPKKRLNKKISFFVASSVFLFVSLRNFEWDDGLEEKKRNIFL
jgi:hypothetical protein